MRKENQRLTIEILKKHGHLLPKEDPESFGEKYKNDPVVREKMKQITDKFQQHALDDARQQAQTAMNNAKKMIYPNINFDDFNGDEHLEFRAIYDETSRQIKDIQDKVEMFKGQSLQFNQKGWSEFLNSMKIPKFSLNRQHMMLTEDFRNGYVPNYTPKRSLQPANRSQFRLNGRDVSISELERAFKGLGLDVKIDVK